MNYKEQYQHPNWQKRRLEILKRDDFTCQKCGDTETMLHVHHKTYYRKRKVWDYKDFDLVTLCKHCHNQIEGIKPSKAEFNAIRIHKSDAWESGSYIMFTTNKHILSMEIFDSDDRFITGFNFPEHDLLLIKPLINTIIKRYNNG